MAENSLFCSQVPKPETKYPNGSLNSQGAHVAKEFYHSRQALFCTPLKEQRGISNSFIILYSIYVIGPI